jgi:hypothetical protein
MLTGRLGSYSVLSTQYAALNDMTITNLVGDQLRLDLLREALPYIQRFQGQTFVVKLSG